MFHPPKPAGGDVELTLCSCILYSVLYTLCAFDFAHLRDYSLLLWEPADGDDDAEWSMQQSALPFRLGPAH